MRSVSGFASIMSPDEEKLPRPLPSLHNLSTGTTPPCEASTGKNKLQKLIFQEAARIARDDTAFGEAKRRYPFLNNDMIYRAEFTAFIEFLESQLTPGVDEPSRFAQFFESTHAIVAPQMSPDHSLKNEDLSAFANIMTDVQQNTSIVDSFKECKTTGSSSSLEPVAEKLRLEIESKLPVFFTKALNAARQHTDTASSTFPLLHLLIQPDINTSRYHSDNLSAGEIHMDNCRDPDNADFPDHSYGLKKRNKEDIASITAFCLELTQSADGEYKFNNTITDTTCGTIIYKNVPILNTSCIENFVSHCRRDAYTANDKKDFSFLIRVLFALSTSRVLTSKLTDQTCSSLPYAMTKYSLPPGQWTQDNFFFFHTSPNIPISTQSASTYWRFFLIAFPSGRPRWEKTFSNKRMEVNGKEFDVNISFRRF